MQRLLFLLIFIFVAFSAIAQKQKVVKAKLTESSVVKDTSGNVIPAALWQQMARNSNFAIYPKDPQQEDTEFIIRRLTAKEKMVMLERMPRPSETKAFRTGKKFSPFSEKDLAGNLHKIKELAGKVVVINFWFINCPPCRMEIPELNEMVAQYVNNKDVVFLAIALDDKWELEQFLKMMPFHYNVIPNGRNIARNYNVSSFPTHVVVDRDGLVKFHTAGLARNTVHWIQKTVEEALAQAPKESVVASH